MSKRFNKVLSDKKGNLAVFLSPLPHEVLTHSNLISLNYGFIHLRRLKPPTSDQCIQYSQRPCKLTGYPVSRAWAEGISLDVETETDWTKWAEPIA